MRNKQTIGKLGERIGEKFLIDKGFQIIDKNFEARIEGYKKGEIDIVALKENNLVFVEVKTSTNKNVLPQENLTFKKIKDLKLTALSWLAQKGKNFSFDSWQIDALIIQLDLENKKYKLYHLKSLTS